MWSKYLSNLLNMLTFANQHGFLNPATTDSVKGFELEQIKSDLLIYNR
jgi:hypothetical protein